MSKYAHIDFAPPKGAQEAAARDALRRRFPQATIIEGDAYALDRTLEGILREPAAAVVSSLPLTTRKPAERLALIGSAAGKWALPPVPANTLVVHGELDDTIPLADVLDWARPQDLAVVVIPGADHFFHRKLHHVKQQVIDNWNARRA